MKSNIIKNIIDENGKVFGIINIIDLTVLLFVVSAITGFAWLMYTEELFRDHNPANKLFIEKNVEIILKNQSNTTITLLRGEMRRTGDDKTALLRIINTTFKKELRVISANNNTKSVELYTVILNLKLKTQVDKSTNISYFYVGVDNGKYYEDIMLQPNKTFQLITGKINVTGRIIKIY